MAVSKRLEVDYHSNRRTETNTRVLPGIRTRRIPTICNRTSHIPTSRPKVSDVKGSYPDDSTLPHIVIINYICNIFTIKPTYSMTLLQILYYVKLRCPNARTHRRNSMCVGIFVSFSFPL